MAYPYRLYGGAARPDALQFDPAFNQAMLDMYASAPPAVQQELGLTSGYRSPQVQQVLWDKSDKTGHSVARPGKSKHQHGTAADLYGFGLGGNSSVSQGTKDWVRANAAAHGLFFPMAHEPWHIQLQGGGGGSPTLQPPGEFTLADTLADAATDPAQMTKRDLYSGLASGIAAGSSTPEQAGPAMTGDPTGAAQMIGLDVPSAIPAAQAAPRLTPTAPALADLFQVADIGAAAMPTQPPRRRA